MGNSDLFQTDAKINDSIFSGFFSILKSFRIVSENSGLLKFFIIPFILNVVVLTAIFLFSYYNISPYFTDLLAGNSWFMSTLRFLIGPVLIAVLAILTILLYSIMGNIITSPFNDILSLKVEEKLTGIDFDENFTFSAFMADIIRISLNIIKLLLYVVCINIVLLIINLIPVAGSLLYSILSFLVTAFFLGFQFFDFPLERRKYHFKEKLKIALRFKFQTVGLGAGFFLISFIPVLGFLGLNLATVGATTLFIDNIKPVLKK